MCCSLDIIGDTELAIKEYLKIKSIKQDGKKYLIVFGILQVLFVQQDVVRNLCESLDVDYELNPELLKIREIRNDSIGHPTKRGLGKGKHFNFIVRPYLGHTGFSLMTAYPNNYKDTKFHHFNIHQIIKNQSKNLSSALRKVIKTLKEEEMKHRKKFRSSSPSAIFPQTIRYHFEKVHEAIYRSSYFELGKINFDLINETIQNFITEL